MLSFNISYWALIKKFLTSRISLKKGLAGERRPKDRVNLRISLLFFHLLHHQCVLLSLFFWHSFPTSSFCLPFQCALATILDTFHDIDIVPIFRHCFDIGLWLFWVNIVSLLFFKLVMKEGYYMLLSPTVDILHKKKSFALFQLCLFSTWSLKNCFAFCCLQDICANIISMLFSSQRPKRGLLCFSSCFTFNILPIENIFAPFFNFLYFQL
jgi:hypothetical protein